MIKSRGSTYGAVGCQINPSLSYFSFQPVLHKRQWCVLSSLWDDAYKISLATN